MRLTLHRRLSTDTVLSPTLDVIDMTSSLVFFDIAVSTEVQSPSVLQETTPPLDLDEEK